MTSDLFPINGVSGFSLVFTQTVHFHHRPVPTPCLAEQLAKASGLGSASQPRGSQSPSWLTSASGSQCPGRWALVVLLQLFSLELSCDLSIMNYQSDMPVIRRCVVKIQSTFFLWATITWPLLINIYKNPTQRGCLACSNSSAWEVFSTWLAYHKLS